MNTPIHSSPDTSSRLGIKNVESFYPLSPMQQGMLFHTVSAPEAGEYFKRLNCVLEGKLDPWLFRQAWDVVVGRHSALRTSFVWEGLKDPIQAVHRRVDIPWHEHDLRDYGSEHQSRYLRGYLDTDFHHGFDVTRPPLMRYALFRTAEDVHRFVWSFHHLLLDGWSVPLLLREVCSAYEDLREGRSIEAAENHPYSNYIAWLKRQDQGAAELFWREYLRGFTAATPFAVDQKVAGDEAERYGSEATVLSQAETKMLLLFARRQKVTLNTVAQAAWAILLSRYSRETDIVFGVTVSGRPAELPGVESTIGLFINTLPLRVFVGPDQPIGEFLRTTQSAQADWGRYEYSSLAQVQRWSDVSPGQPLFESILVFENYPDSNVGVGQGTTIRIRDVESLERTSLPLMALVNAGQELHISLAYDARRFAQSAVAGLLHHFRNLLLGMMAAPEHAISELPMMEANETEQIVDQWNNTAVEYAFEGWVPELIEKQVKQTPDAIAVRFENGDLTYAELNRRANQLARYLQQRGAGRDKLVGVFMERSREMVVALLGAMKAGAAYVPVDPDYPAERVRFMLENAQVPVLLTQENLLKRLPPLGAELMCVDRDWRQLAQQSSEDVDAGIGGDDLCYVIYTSGSTGQPKGAMNTHRGLRNRLLWMQQTYALNASDRVLQKTPFSFDVSVWEFFWPLLTGACIVMARSGGHKDPEYLADVIKEEKITTLHFVPSMLQQILHEERMRGCGTVRRVICSGEALPAEVQENFFRQSDAELHNLYGPTEASIDVTWWRCERVNKSATVPIGRPIANTEIYILDEQLRPVPVGVSGELHIGGVGVGRGYWRREELTAEKFIADRFRPREGAERLYKSGDLARYRADGAIEYLGRLDAQVKIRGQRIELGEIDATLKQHAGVRDAVVVVREDAPGDKRLVAYLVGEGDTKPGVTELRGFMRERLPEWMVPAAWVWMAALPLSPNGKLDRRALPAPELGRPELGKAYVAPRTTVEELLAQIWGEVLKLDKVGVRDDFFELGGDSILSMQIVSRMRQAGLEVTSRQLFQHPTVAELARVARREAVTRGETGTVTGEIPLTHIQHWFFEQNLTAPEHWNLSILLRPRTPVDPATLDKAIGIVTEHHDSFRLRFDRRNGAWRQHYAQGSPIPLEKVVLRAATHKQRMQELAEHAASLQSTLNLASGPLARAVLFTSRGDQRVLLIAHHLIVDGVSWRILLQDLETVYQQLKRGAPVTLAPQTASYGSWAERLKKYATSPELDGDSSCCMQQRWSEVRPLPLNSGDDSTTEAAAVTFSRSLTDEETAQLVQRLPRAYGAQVEELLIAALASGLHDAIGEGSFAIDVEGFGRHDWLQDIDVSRTVGWFTSIHSVVVSSSGDGISALKFTKEAVRGTRCGALAYGVRRYLRGDNRTGETDSQILFNYLGQFDQVFSRSSIFELAFDAVGPQHGLQNARRYPLEVNVSIFNGQCNIVWTYTPLLDAQTVGEIADRFVHALRAFVHRCDSIRECVHTPSDFPLAKVAQQQIERIYAEHGHIDDIYPLSPMQHGMLFHSLYEPEGGVYLEQMTCSLRGEVDPDLLQRAWQAVIDAHPALRTGFVWQDLSQPLQVVFRNVRLRMAVEDWRGAASEDQASRLEQRLAADRAKGFELSVPPLMRVTLIQLEDRFNLVWSWSHLLLDGWCLPILLREVFASYDALSNRETPNVVAGGRYRDYIEWLSLQDESASESFWRDQLKGFTAATPLTFRNTSPAPPKKDYAMARLQVPIPIAEPIARFAREQQLTINTMLQGAWGALLSRYSGDPDVVFGTTFSGRPDQIAGSDTAIGLFINTLPVRLQVAASDQVLPFLKRVQEHQLELRQYQHSPLVKIQACSDIAPSAPLFHSILVCENYPVSGASLSMKVGVEDVRLIERTNYPITVIAVPGRELLLAIIYESGQFEAAAIQRVLVHLANLLSAMSSAPGQRICAIEFLTESEKLSLKEWNGTSAAYDCTLAVPELVADIAQSAPERLAVASGPVLLSYGELDRRANQLANYLQRLGIGPDAVVGVFAARSPEMIVALLAVLKAGGAYLPIDPDLPEARVRFLIGDAGCAAVLTAQQLNRRVVGAPVPVLCLDSGWDQFASESETAPATLAGPQDLAYVIYTSGSTGMPKGVEVEHRSLLNLIRWHHSAYRVSHHDRATQLANPAFDASVWEIWAYLTAGASLHLPDDETRSSPKVLLEWLAAENITLTFLPTPLAEAVLEQQLPAGLQLRALLTGGDRLRRAPKKQLPFQLVNHYGPTENTVVATCCDIDPFAEGPPPIGRPIANVQVYVLDEQRQPVPVGVPGRLYVAGESLARGYHGRMQLTAEKFVESPFSGRAGARMYDTGDLVRFRDDGNLEFLGRLDHQVKVRGFRIELGEIESCLAGHEAVSNCAVLLREDQSGQKQLVAYVAPRREPYSTSSELRAYLGATLPSYMVPTEYVFLDSLPLTPHGKIDRAELLRSKAVGESTGTYVPPRTPIEENLCRIWAEVLNVPRVSVHDNFFRLGGDSILTIQIVSRARQAGLSLTAKQCFEHQTVAELADVAGTPAMPALEQGAVVGEVPLMPIQHWFFEQGLVEPHHFNQSVLLALRERLEPALLEKVVDHLLRHHDALRTRFERKGANWVQWIADVGESPSVVHFDLTGIAGSERKKAMSDAAHELATSLDLQHGPMIRFALFDFGSPENGRLLIIAHHLVVDGVSWRVLLDDIEAIYKQLQSGAAVTPAQKTTSVKSWAEKLVSDAESPAVKAQEKYWISAAGKRSTKIATELNRGDNLAGSARIVTKCLSQDETGTLVHRVPRVGAQVHELLIAALIHALGCWTGASVHKIDVEGHGHEAVGDGVDVSRTVGWFTSIHPVSLDIPPLDPPGTLKLVQEQLRRVPSNGRDYGLLRHLRRNDSVRHALQSGAASEISFNYLGQFDQTLANSQLFGVAPEPTPPERSPLGQRQYLLEVDSAVVQQQLNVRITYSENLHRKTTMEALLDLMMTALRSMTVHAAGLLQQAPRPEFVTPNITSGDLQTLFSKLSKTGSTRTS